MKPVVVILNHSSDNRLTLKFLLSRTKVEQVTFNNELELENWLRHCVDAATLVLGVIVESDFCETRHFSFAFSELLSCREIPLIVTDTSRTNHDWCEVSSVMRLRMPVYLATLNLLPQLLEELRMHYNQRLSGNDRRSKG